MEGENGGKEVENKHLLFYWPELTSSSYTTTVYSTDSLIREA